MVMDLVNSKNDYIDSTGQTVPLQDARFDAIVRGERRKCGLTQREDRSVHEYRFRDSSCGPNALLFVLQLNGIELEHEALIASLPPEHRGPKAITSLADLAEVARVWGLSAFPSETDIAGLRGIDAWSIAQFKSAHQGEPDHFVALRAEGDSFHIVDPPTGSTLAQADEVRAKWTGKVLFLAREESALFQRLHEGRSTVSTWMAAAILAVASIAALLFLGRRRLFHSGGV
jgi:hypothetical protein